VQKLKQAIADNDVLTASLLVATKLDCGDQLDIDSYQECIAVWAQQAKIEGYVFPANEAAFKRLIKYFYVVLAFSDNQQNYFACQYSLLNQVMDYRTGIPVSLAIVFQSMAVKLGFDVQGVNFPGHFLLRYQVTPERILYLDPSNGKILSLADLENLYFNILSEIDDEKMPIEALQAANCDEIIVRLLHNLKAAYINEKKYQQALSTVELLVGLCPEDPYERRDRGFLLHQLDCTQVAIADYQYFIRQCPKDPASQLLEVQVRQLNDSLTVQHIIDSLG
jgi:regulator of sirC expression with transglutaminase-like and TPR domain